MGDVAGIRKGDDLTISAPGVYGEEATVWRGKAPLTILKPEQWDAIHDPAYADFPVYLGRLLEHPAWCLGYYRGALYEIPYSLVQNLVAVADEESDPADPDAVLAALLDDVIESGRREARRAIQFARSMDLDPIGDRPRIPDEVKIFVWRRDEGACVRCGRREDLEFDHIIPIASGGSSTSRNLQLLCERCNRSKGANLV